MSAAAPNNDLRLPPSQALDTGAGGAALAPVTVLLVDDDRAASYSLWALLNWHPGIRLIGTAGTSREALALAQRLRPHVCLVSATLGRGEGIALTHELGQLPDPPHVLIHADRLEPALEGRAMIAGAAGVLWRYDDPDAVASAIQGVRSGAAEPATTDSIVIDALIDRVEERDRAIAAMLLLRTPGDEIARTLGISARALRSRRQEIVKRLGPVGSVDVTDPHEHRSGASSRSRGQRGSEGAIEPSLARAA